jgi:hypothetical protein
MTKPRSGEIASTLSKLSSRSGMRNAASPLAVRKGSALPEASKQNQPVLAGREGGAFAPSENVKMRAFARKAAGFPHSGRRSRPFSRKSSVNLDNIEIA